MSAPASPGTISPEEALHDVSNALTVLLGWLAAAQEDGDDKARENALRIASTKARQAQSLARRAIGATSAVEPSRAVGDVVREVADSLAIELARGGLSLQLHGAEATAKIAEPSAVAHVLTNLALNAIAFAPASTSIKVGVSIEPAASAGGAVHVDVVDEGPGVPAELTARIFEGASRRPGGAGIGLAHARREARRLGGELALAPTIAPSRGATFRLTVPLDDSPAIVSTSAGDGFESAALSARTRILVSGVRVLVIEDDRAVCALLDAGLGARGAEVVAIHDGSNLAHALPPLGRFDAVLLDLSPIADDVGGAIATVRRVLPGAGIIFISGSAVGVPADLTQSAPGVRWVRKPFDIGELTGAIAELVALQR